ncbi:MAG: DUF3035 domain-containing protein [Pseudomonadota bacterium]
MTTQSSPIKSALFLAILATTSLTGCDRIKEEFGMSRRAPDEFAIVRGAPLEMPPDLRLATPQPGAPRPQDISPAELAKASLLGGDPAARPAPQPTATGLTTSDSEFLGKLGAAQATPDIRTTIQQEAIDESNSSRTAIQKLMGKKGETAGQVLNPLDEENRLKKQGAPVIPVPEAINQGKPIQGLPSRDLTAPPVQ